MTHHHTIKTPKHITVNPVQSTSIKAIGYDPATQTMRIAYHNGPHYDYHGVSPALHEALSKAPSKGKWLCEHVLGKFKFTKGEK